MPPAYVKTVREEIYYEYAKLISRSAHGSIQYAFEKLGLAGTVKWTMTAAAQEYHETMAIEKAISEDPKKREAWLTRQLELEPVSNGLAESVEALAEE